MITLLAPVSAGKVTFKFKLALAEIPSGTEVGDNSIAQFSGLTAFKV